MFSFMLFGQTLSERKQDGEEFTDVNGLIFNPLATCSEIEYIIDKIFSKGYHLGSIQHNGNKEANLIIIHHFILNYKDTPISTGQRGLKRSRRVVGPGSKGD